MESFFLKLAASGFGTAVALGAIWLVWKTIKISKTPEIAEFDEESSVVRRPSWPGVPRNAVTEDVCVIRQKMISNQIDMLAKDVKKSAQTIDDVSEKIDQVKEVVAVLKDRSNRS